MFGTRVGATGVFAHVFADRQIILQYKAVAFGAKHALENAS